VFDLRHWQREAGQDAVFERFATLRILAVPAVYRATPDLDGVFVEHLHRFVVSDDPVVLVMAAQLAAQLLPLLPGRIVHVLFAPCPYGLHGAPLPLATC